MLPNQAAQLTWCLACAIPVSLIGLLYFVMKGIGGKLHLWQGMVIIIVYTVTVGFLFFSVIFPKLADLNRELTFQRIQSDLDAQCGVNIVNVHAGYIDDSTLNTWRMDADVSCVLAESSTKWTCTCPR